MVTYRKVAYGKPKNVKGAGKLLNTGSLIGTRIVQYVYLRPPAIGYRAATGKKK